MNLDLSTLAQYEIKQQKRLSDIHSDGYYLEHRKSGARIVIASNEDENKVFYIGFRTPPKNSTGVAHIIEHTVLCGSRKFPVKDPFIELLKGSMNTFLNAMTYPDKTVYPVASCNDKDFQNLMDVYMDAVLHPNIYQEQNIFRQEGWHYELESEDAELKINGVVYNEMKGAFSSADSVLDREILNSLYPDTTYRNESGGDPDVIPMLTYEEYLDFHRTYYHPCNSYIYLYGNMDVEEKLRWLDEEYLQYYDRIVVDSAIPLQKPFDAPIEIEKSYSIASAESEEKRSYLSCNWAIGTNLDPLQYLAFTILEYALLSSHGAPVKQALFDAGIGDDIYGGYDNGVLQPYFSIIAKNTDPDRQEQFLQIIRDTLEGLAENGLDRETLLSAINGAEFKFREADFGRIPKGLMFGLQMMDSWIYDENSPFLLMDELTIFAELKQRIDTGYFEHLITDCLLNNPHASIVRIVPEKGLNAKREQALARRLKDYRDSLSPEDIQNLIAETKALEDYQEEPSPKSDLDKIPLLSRDDMKKTSEPFSNETELVEQVPFVWHDYETNGIVYLDYLFDIRHIREEQIPLIGLLNILIGRLDTAEYPFRELSNEIHLHTGGISTEANVLSILGEEQAYRAHFEVRMRTLAPNLQKTMELANSMMLRTLFTDDKRISEILAQTKSRIQSELSESGNSVAAQRAAACYSGKAKYNDLLHGISFFRVLERITSDYESQKEALKTQLGQLIREIMQKGGLTVSVTCRRPEYELVRTHAAGIFAGLFEDGKKDPVFIDAMEAKNEGFMDASRIQYVALAGDYGKKGYSYTGAMRIFRSIMNYDYLWQNVRVRGGAYGCACNINRSGEIVFASYRDPNLEKTLDVYRGIADYLESFDADERDMTRFVIGTFSDMDAPLTPVSNGRRSMIAMLTGTTWDIIQKDREDVLSAKQEDIRNLAQLMRDVLEDSYICTIGNEERLRKESALFDSLEPLVRSSTQA